MIINAAFHLADFIWKVITDSKSIKKYYGSAGNDILTKLANGKYEFEATNTGMESVNLNLRTGNTRWTAPALSF